MIVRDDKKILYLVALLWYNMVVNLNSNSFKMSHVLYMGL